MRRLVVIPGDQIFKYYEKGEIKARYWNPCGLFDEVHILSLNESDIEPEKVQALVGDAELHIHAVGRPTALTLAFYYFKITRIIRRLDPDLIRAHGPWHSGSLGAFAGKRLGIPCIGSIHNDIDIMRRYERQILLRLVEPLVQYTFRNASVILCVSNYLHKYVRAHGGRRMITNYNRVYLSQFLQTETSRPARDMVTILCVMRLDRQKNPECLLRAVHAAPGVQLKLVGQGELEESSKALAQELAIEDRVEFIPMVPNAEIHRLYQEADIFALATYYEGFCIPILEAMAAALPVVACATDPIPELLGDTGTIVDMNPQAFASAFSRLAGDTELRQTMGQRARQRAMSFDGGVMEEREAEIFSAYMSDDRAEIDRILSPEYRYIEP
ncbi:MAG: glycosyltransferase family 4 protein [Planctomycetota bacterium]|nr:glycosyltransferase family 4 protein [Planctomycetota bacterium]|tara:strand:+ start:61 stop:1215 length:1155 start_codon:yes stop_codon:yes gene_type:complete